MTLQDFLSRNLQDLQLRGMALSTQDDYVRAVRKISEHYTKLPNQITEDELREYFIYLKNVRKLGRSASTLAMCGLKFFYTYTLKRDWPTLTLVRAPHEFKLPVVLNQQQVKQLLSTIRIFRHRACLTTIYGCGLRLTEGTHIQVGDIDSHHMLVHVKHGKGGKDRFVPLPEKTLLRCIRSDIPTPRIFWKKASISGSFKSISVINRPEPPRFIRI